MCSKQFLIWDSILVLPEMIWICFAPGWSMFKIVAYL